MAYISASAVRCFWFRASRPALAPPERERQRERRRRAPRRRRERPGRAALKTRIEGCHSGVCSAGHQPLPARNPSHRGWNSPEAGRGDARNSPSLDKRRGFNPRHPGPQLSALSVKRPGLGHSRSSGAALLGNSRSLAAPAGASPLPLCSQNRQRRGTSRAAIYVHSDAEDQGHLDLEIRRTRHGTK